ncbi:MAG: hypothetical protein LBJ35_06655, partial [Spirochaetaceae bacterium]|nr:hypothetical protein [Spirochaetaceae bacterium]
STTHGVESLTGGVEFAPRARQRVSIRYAAAYRESPTQQGVEFALRANSGAQRASSAPRLGRVEPLTNSIFSVIMRYGCPLG